MRHQLAGCVLRPLEDKDGRQLYQYKNDVEVSSLLGGFHTGLSLKDIEAWLEFHRKQKSEILWAIADSRNDKCLGHVGLYQIDHRVRSAEFAIMLGSKSHWGKGIGRAVTKCVIDWAFSELNLNRMSLSVLSTNARAVNLYKSLGFKEEGCLREAQFKNGRYVDVILMSILASGLKK